jgi:hypothetical protein
MNTTRRRGSSSRPIFGPTRFGRRLQRAYERSQQQKERAARRSAEWAAAEARDLARLQQLRRAKLVKVTPGIPTRKLARATIRRKLATFERDQSIVAYADKIQEINEWRAASGLSSLMNAREEFLSLPRHRQIEIVNETASLRQEFAEGGYVPLAKRTYHPLFAYH